MRVMEVAELPEQEPQVLVELAQTRLAQLQEQQMETSSVQPVNRRTTQEKNTQPAQTEVRRQSIPLLGFCLYPASVDATTRSLTRESPVQRSLTPCASPTFAANAAYRDVASAPNSKMIADTYTQVNKAITAPTDP